MTISQASLNTLLTGSAVPAAKIALTSANYETITADWLTGRLARITARTLRAFNTGYLDDTDAEASLARHCAWLAQRLGKTFPDGNPICVAHLVTKSGGGARKDFLLTVQDLSGATVVSYTVDLTLEADGTPTIELNSASPTMADAISTLF